MSEIRTTRGVQPTLGFQEKGEGVAAAEAGLTSPGTANSVEMARMAISSVILGLLRVNLVSHPQESYSLEICCVNGQIS